MTHAIGQKALSEKVLIAIASGPEKLSPTHPDAIKYGKKKESARDFAQRIALIVLEGAMNIPGSQERLASALRDLVEIVEAAISAGHWKVDGACDPDAILYRANRLLSTKADDK